MEEQFLPNELLIPYMSPDVARLVSKSIQRDTYRDYVKYYIECNFCEGDDVSEFLYRYCDPKHPLYEPNKILGYYFSTMDMTADCLAEYVFDIGVTGLDIFLSSSEYERDDCLGTLTDIQLIHEKLNPDAIWQQNFIQLDCKSMYEIFMTSESLSDLRDENISVYSVAVLEYLVEKLRNHTRDLVDKSSIVYSYAWLCFNCYCCGIDFPLNEDYITAHNSKENLDAMILDISEAMTLLEEYILGGNLRL